MKQPIFELVAPCAPTTMDIPTRDCVILGSLVPEPYCNHRIKMLNTYVSCICMYNTPKIHIPKVQTLTHSIYIFFIYIFIEILNLF